MKELILLLILVVLLASCTYRVPQETQIPAKEITEDIVDVEMKLADGMYRKAVVAGGCFWCMEPPFEALDGVIYVIAGYAGGSEEDAEYGKVSAGRTQHYEAVQITYDPLKITFRELLDVFWLNIDASDSGGQFADRGNQYKTAIFYMGEEEKLIAEQSTEREQKNYDDPIQTKILPFTTFFEAEEYHQDYYEKKEAHYEKYKKGSGREDFIKEKEKMEEEKMQEKIASLTPLQYHVTQEGGTETPFDNEYWDNHEDGIYVDVVTGKPLFSSNDKFDSGSGWPAFTRTIEESVVEFEEDRSLGMLRTEVLSEDGSHLGHVFDDGPDGLPRYCINSAALRFIPLADLEKEGYAEYEKLFEES